MLFIIMIYLIDDTNIDSVNALFLCNEEYGRILHRITDIDSLNKSLTMLSSADCIMIHKTFADSIDYAEKMKELTSFGEKIPLILFSAGDPEQATYDDNQPYIINGIKKRIFYTRLFTFLKVYLESHILNLRLIAYGNNYLKIKVRSLALSIIQPIAVKEGIITVSELATIASNPAFKELISIANPALNITYDDLLEEMEDNPISFHCFKEKINNIVNSFYQYGKNIYTWK